MTIKRLAIVGGIGALVMYFFDPRMGRTRRTRIASRIGGITRRGARRMDQRGRYISGQVEGLQRRVSGTGSDLPPANDATLTDKVESEVLSRWNYPKGSISVNAEDGVLYLRGEAENPDQIRDLEREVRRVDGVIDVVNLLHLPGTPAPNKQDAMQASYS